MQPAENKDYSRDVILRLSPTRNTIIVEEQKPGGIAAYREIDPLELYYVINQSYPSATLPPGSWAKILFPSALISFARTECGISVPKILILLP